LFYFIKTGSGQTKGNRNKKTVSAGAALRARPTATGAPGSLMPLFVFSAIFQLLAGWSFGLFASVVPAREVLAAADAKKEAARC